MRPVSAVVAFFALLALATGWWQLERATDGLTISRLHVGAIPVTVFRPAATPPSPGSLPVVVITHGFAGSQQLMQPFAVTLARNGYAAITFDFPGHGRNPSPMAGGLADPAESERTLLAALDRVAAFGRTMAGGDGRYALIGHSMASAIVVRHAQTHREAEATIAVSLFAPSIAATNPRDSPRNVLVIDGALEPAMMKTEALRVVGRVAGDKAQEGVTYGSFDNGTARRAVLAGGVEHIGVLYSARSLAEALSWLNQAFRYPPAPGGETFIDARGPWLGLLLLGVVGLAWPLSRLLPRLAAPEVVDSASARGRWRRFWPVALLPAVITPLVLGKLPSEFLPILLGGYLALHFGLYGLLTLAGLRLRDVRMYRGRDPQPQRSSFALVAAIGMTTAYGLLAVGIPADLYVLNFRPAAVRLPLILAMLIGTLPYFLADEWLTRGAHAPRGAYALTKICFLLSLAGAIALNVHKLFFLAIIVPAILVLFVVYGLFSGWIHRRTRHAVVAAVANALAFAWFMGVTFPLVS